MTVWLHKIQLSDVFHDEDRSFEERRDEIVRRLRASGLFTDNGGEIDCTIDELAETDDVDYFDMVWDAVYDFADRHRIWIETHGVPIS